MSLIERLKRREKGIAAFSNDYGSLVYPKLTGPIKNRMYFQGKEVVVWSLNDYLGLSCDDKVIDLELRLVAKYGVSYPGGSRLLSGNTEAHEILESELEKLTGKHCSLLNLVYAGTISILHSLLDRNDVAVYDQRVHASIIDGLKGHLGRKISFRHNDVDHLKKQLQRATELKDRDAEIFVIVDGIYSMSGEMAPFSELIKLKKEFHFTLIVDDSHGFLVFEAGGSPQHARVFNDIDIYISSFGKALGNIGGFVAATQELSQYFKYNLRSQIFGRSLSIVHVESVLEKLKMIFNQPDRRRKLWENTTALQAQLCSLGIGFGQTKSPITPVLLKCPENIARQFVITLREFGVFCSAVVYPVIPKDQILLRLVVTALHTEDDILQTVHAFGIAEKQVLKEREIIVLDQE